MEALDTLLVGGETISRQLAGASYQIYVLPNQEIIREHDIISHVYVVHRGRVAIYIGKDRIATLTKVLALILVVFETLPSTRIVFACTFLR